MTSDTRIFALALSRIAFRPAAHAWLIFTLIGSWTAILQAADSETDETDGVPVEYSQADLDSGRQLVRAYCTRCHGLDATGARAPDLSQRVLRHANSFEAMQRVVRNGIPGTGMAGFKIFQPRQLRQVVSFLQHRRQSSKPPELTGDVEKGQALFATLQCASCHWTGTSGGRRGPDLSKSRGRLEYVRNAIVDPGTDVDRQFLQVTVVRADGSVVQGMRLSENSFYIQLIDGNDDFYTIEKSAVERIYRSSLSLMPSYKEVLSDEDLDNLIAFVFELRKE